MDGSQSHAALMDATYRHQRLIYDLTRRYYLLGRDRLISELAAPAGGSVLEIACGTGRNLHLIARRYPGCNLYGMDISEEMLRSARATLGNRARLAQGDACRFDPTALFGVAKFDRVVLSYSLSMIPDWNGALAQAARLVAPGGSCTSSISAPNRGCRAGSGPGCGPGLRVSTSPPATTCAPPWTGSRPRLAPRSDLRRFIGIMPSLRCFP